MRTAECHPERGHWAKGLCAQCYMREYDKARAAKRSSRNRKDPSEYAPNYRRPPHKPARVPTCHPERKHAAKGLCGACYQREVADRPRAACHPDRALVADGLCRACYAARRYWDNPEEARRKANAVHKRLRDRVRAEMVAAYGGRCVCPRCPETNPAFLTLEHTDGNGKAHRAQIGSHAYADLRRRGWPKEGFALLCWNCNAMTRFGRTCPHMEEA